MSKAKKAAPSVKGFPTAARPAVSGEKFHWLFLPVLLVLIIVPLAVRMIIVTLDADTLRVFGPPDQVTTLYAQAKAIPLWILAAVMAVIAACLFKKLWEKRDRATLTYLIASGAFVLLTLLSSVFSQYPQVAFFGIYDRAEGFFSILCYFVIFLYTMYIFEGSRDFRYLIFALFIVVGVNAFLGVFEYIGQDLISSELGRWLIIPSQYRDNAQLSLLYEAGKVHGTLFHYNYVGSLAAMVVPLFLVLALYAENRIQRVILGIFVLLSVWLLFGSTSRAGLIGVGAAAVFGVVIFAKAILKKWKPVCIGLGVCVIAAVGLNAATRGSVFERIPGLFQDVFSIFQDTSELDYRDYIPVRDIQNGDDGSVTLTTQTGALTISGDTTQEIRDEEGKLRGYTLAFRDENGAPVDYVFDPEAYLYSTSDPRFASFTFGAGSTAERLDKVAVVIDGQQLFRLNVDSGGKLHLANFSSGLNVDLENPPTFGFQGKERLGSMRGYIWSRAIPMLQGTALLGDGPDTFALEFPQNDQLAIYYAYGTPRMTVDKPHNLYLQIGLNEGLPALGIFLALMAVFVVDGLRLYALRREYDREQVMGAAVLLAIIGYLFAGLFNDSIIGVAPVFWILLGTGAALNWRNRKKRKPAPQNRRANTASPGKAAGTTH